MGGEEDCLGHAVMEANEGMLPVTNVIPEPDIQDCGTKVV